MAGVRRLISSTRGWRRYYQAWSQVLARTKQARHLLASVRYDKREVEKDGLIWQTVDNYPIYEPRVGEWNEAQ